MSTQPSDASNDTPKLGLLHQVGRWIIATSLLGLAAANAKELNNPVICLKLALLYGAVASLGAYYYRERDQTSAALCASMAVCTVPEIVHSVMALNDLLLWPALRSLEEPGVDPFWNMHGYVIPMAISAILASIAACRLLPHPWPLMTVPHVLGLSTLAMEAARLYRNALHPHVDDCFIWGVFLLLYAQCVENWFSVVVDYARYFHMMAAGHVWYAVSQKCLVDHHFNGGHAMTNLVIYALFNLGYLVLSTRDLALFVRTRRRRVFQVLGWLGLLSSVSEMRQHWDAVSLAALTCLVGVCMILVSDRVPL